MLIPTKSIYHLIYIADYTEGWRLILPFYADIQTEERENDKFPSKVHAYCVCR
jgi:hypothetical protein